MVGDLIIEGGGNLQAWTCQPVFVILQHFRVYASSCSHPASHSGLALFAWMGVEPEFSFNVQLLFASGLLKISSRLKVLVWHSRTAMSPSPRCFPWNSWPPRHDSVLGQWDFDLGRKQLDIVEHSPSCPGKSTFRSYVPLPSIRYS